MNKRLQILHLEDLHSDAELIGRALKRGGLDFERLVVDTREKYINALNEFHPDIILSDHSLPSFNSHEALAILLKTGVRIPFILITSNISEEFAVDVIKRGADDYILKDRLERLPNAILSSLEKFRLEKESRIFLDELIKNEKYYRALVENSGDAVVILNEEGKPTYASPSVKRVLGYDEAETIQLDLFEIHHPDDREGVAKNIFDCLLKPGVPQEGHVSRVMHKDGRWIWLEETLTNMLHDLSIKGIVNNFRDITEKKLAEEKIKQVNRLYIFISQINQTIVHSQDQETVFKEACYIAVEFGKFKSAWIGLIDSEKRTVNLVAEEGITSEDITLFTNVPLDINGPMHHVVHTGNYLLCNDIQNFSETYSWRCFAIERGYGSFIILPILKSGVIIGTFNLYASEINFFNSDEVSLLVEATGDISFAMDVFEKDKLRTQAEQKVKHKQLRLSHAEAIAHLGNWEIDFSTGIALWSQESCRIYGLPPEDHIQSYESWLSFIHPDDLENVLKVTKEAETTRSNVAFFHRIIRKDGSIRHIYSKTELQFNIEGKPSGLYGIAHDVTEMKETEAALKESERVFNELARFNQNLIEVSPLGIGSYDAKSGKCLSANSALAKILGIEPKDVLDQNFRNIESWKNSGLLQDAEDTLLNGNVHHKEIHIKTSFDHAVWIDYTLIKFLNEGQFLLLILINDITERKLAEDALKKSESGYRHIVETAQEGMWIMDENNKTTFVNQKMCEILEYTSEEMYGKENLYFMDDAGKEATSYLMEKKKQGLKENHDVHYITKSGKHIWTNISANPIFDEDKKYKGALAMVTDITERKKSEDENRFKANLLNTIGQAVIGTDLNGRVNYWNRASEKIYGWTALEAIGKNIIDLTPSNQTKEQSIEIMEDLKKGNSWLGELELQRKDGTVFPAFVTDSPTYDSDQNLTGIIGISSDISEQKKLEGLLNEANILARMGSYEVDLVNNTSYWSSITKEIHEVNKDFIPDIESGINCYKAGESRDAISLAVKEAIEKNIPFDLELQIVSAKGNECWVRVIGKTESREGKCIRLYGSFQDIDKIKKTEITLKEMNKSLENYTNELVISNKELEQFSYIVSHNLRAPVANIIGLSEELNIDFHNIEVKKALKKELSSSVKRLDNVIIDLNSILKVKRETSERKDVVNLSDLTESIELSIKNLIQKENVQIRTDFSIVNEFKTLKSYLLSIFYNLILNSIMYRNPDLSPVIEIKSERSEGKLIITFKDNGMGIDMKKNGDQVFGLYKRFHPHIEGKGMGLFMVKTQVETLGGSITIKSEVNKGTEFKIEF
jgi:PAS domain S-box-containing protein